MHNSTSKASQIIQGESIECVIRRAKRVKLFKARGVESVKKYNFLNKKAKTFHVLAFFPFFANE